MTTTNLSNRDMDFFHDVISLMNDKYPEMIEKFGIWRVHQHFELGQNEVFHETSNSTTRESILKIINKENLPEGAFASSWRLNSQGSVVATWCCDEMIH